MKKFVTLLIVCFCFSSFVACDNGVENPTNVAPTPTPELAPIPTPTLELIPIVEPTQTPTPTETETSF